MDTLKQGRQRASHTGCPPRPRVLSPLLSPALSPGPRTGRGCPPLPLPPAPASTAWGQPFMLLPAGDPSPQTLPAQPPRSAQRYQRPSQAPPLRSSSQALPPTQSAQNSNPCPVCPRPRRSSYFLCSTFAFFNSSTSLNFLLSLLKNLV